MKTITLNFKNWNNGASGGRLRRIYKRIYIKGYIWTPLVIVTWRILDKETKEKIFINELEIETLTNLRDTLLPKLISGEVRVKDVEHQITKVI